MVSHAFVEVDVVSPTVCTHPPHEPPPPPSPIPPLSPMLMFLSSCLPARLLSPSPHPCSPSYLPAYWRTSLPSHIVAPLLSARLSVCARSSVRVCELIPIHGVGSVDIGGVGARVPQLEDAC